MRSKRGRYICKAKKTERDGMKNRIRAKCGTGDGRQRREEKKVPN